MDNQLTDPVEIQLAMLRHEYCRDLVREGRLDWAGFDPEPVVVDRVLADRIAADDAPGETRRRRRLSLRRR